MAHNTRELAPPSYIDGISVKISERYKPPKRIAVALSYSQRLTLTKLMHDPIPSYDFKLEESIRNRMSEWRRARTQISDGRRLRLQQLQNEHATKSDEIVENCEVLSDEEPCFNLSSNYSMESGVLIPMTVHSILPANVSEHLSYQMNKVFNFSEFESDTSSPFDNMELKTINDLEELAEVLKRDSVNTKLIKNAHLANNNNNDPATSPATFPNNYSQRIKKNADPNIDTTVYSSSFHNSSPTFSISDSFSNSYSQNAPNFDHSKDSNNTPVYSSSSSYHSASPTLSAIDSSFSNSSFSRNNPKNSFDSSKDSNTSTINSFHSSYNNQNMKSFHPSSPTFSSAYSLNNTKSSPSTFSALEAFPNNSYNQNITNEPSNDSSDTFSNRKHPNAKDNNTTSYNTQNIKTFEPSSVLDSFPSSSYNPLTSSQSVLTPYSSYTYKTNFMDSKDSHMNGYYYPNSPHFASRLYDPADLKSEQMRDPSVRSVYEIMQSLQAELAHTQLPTPQQSPVTPSPVAASSTASSSPAVKQSDGLENPFTTLGNELQEMALKISGMGFPLGRVARACLAMDGNQKKIVEHLLVMAELLDLGFTEQNVVAALLKSDNDRDKALDLLIT